MTSPAKDSSSAAAILSAMQLKYFSAWPTMQLCEQTERGRFIVARSPIAAGTVVFESVPYCKGVHESFKKRVCECCLRYNHCGRFERTCGECHAVWFCSAECEARANGRPTDAAPLLPSELHSLDCSLLRKLSSCKLDKARMGVIRLLIRAARKMQCEIIAEQKRIADASASSSAAASSAPPTAASGPLLPTYHDVANLVGHAPAPLVPGRSPSLHQLDTIDMRKFLTKIVATTVASATSPAASAAALPPLDVEVLMDLLAKVESNAFGMYAPKKRDESEMADATAEITQAVDALTTNEPAASVSVSSSSSAVPAASSPPPAVLLPSVPSKYIGVLLYPIASFFNHSCESNLRCVQLHAQDSAPSSSEPSAASSAVPAAASFVGPKLVMIAKRDIAEGEELSIEYIDTERNGAERRAELQELYRFDCGCTRCVREQAAESAASSAFGKKSASVSAASAPRPSYAPASNRGGHTKKGAPPKRKKIVPKSMQQQPAIDDANASTVATATEE